MIVNKIVIEIDDENQNINISTEGKANIKLKSAAIACGRVLGAMLRGYDENIVETAAQYFGQALVESYTKKTAD